MNIIENCSNITKQKPAANQSAKKTMTVNNSDSTPYKHDIMDVFCKKVVNQNDIKDMVTVPRTIFKGYLCFTTGTAITSIASMVKTEKIAKILSITGILTSIYGTFNFVKPFLIREKELTKNEK